MAKATALARARRVRHPQKPKPQSAQIGPDGPTHPGNRQLYDKRGRPDAGARLPADYLNLKVATFCAALWPTFTLPLSGSSLKGPTQNRDKFTDYFSYLASLLKYPVSSKPCCDFVFIKKL